MRITIPKRMFGKPIEGDLEKFLEGEKNIPPDSNPQVAPLQAAGRVIDSVSWLDGKSQTQNQWIEYANANKFKMISAPDLYLAGKSVDKNLIKSLQKDFNESYIMTGTQIHYNPTNLEGEIIHYAGSNIVKPVVMQKIKIPIYGRTSLADALKDPYCVDYLQALFNTKNNKISICETLLALSGKTDTSTYLWTPDQSSRASTPVRVVWFDYLNGVFHVCGLSDPDDGSGRSRGVQ